MRSRISVISAFIMLAILTVGVIISLLLGEWVIAMLIVIGVSLTALVVFLQLRVLVTVSELKQEQRSTRKIVSDIAGTVGRSAPLIRALATQGGSHLDELSVSSLAAGSSDAYRRVESTLNDIWEKLISKEKMESQTLHQITGEARLMRMHLERALFESDNE